MRWLIVVLMFFVVPLLTLADSTGCTGRVYYANGTLYSENATLPASFCSTTSMVLDQGTFLFLLFALIVVIAIVAHKFTVFSALAGLYGVVYGIYLVSTEGFWVGLIVMSVGTMFGYVAFKE